MAANWFIDIFSSRHQRQTWRSSLRPKVDVSSGGEADARPPQRLEVPLHGLRSLSIHPSILFLLPSGSLSALTVTLPSSWSSTSILFVVKLQVQILPPSWLGRRHPCSFFFSWSDSLISGWNPLELIQLKLPEHPSSVWFVLCENKVDLLIEL